MKKYFLSIGLVFALIFSSLNSYSQSDSFSYSSVYYGLGIGYLHDLNINEDLESDGLITIGENLGLLNVGLEYMHKSGFGAMTEIALGSTMSSESQLILTKVKLGLQYRMLDLNGAQSFINPFIVINKAGLSLETPESVSIGEAEFNSSTNLTNSSVGIGLGINTKIWLWEKEIQIRVAYDYQMTENYWQTSKGKEVTNLGLEGFSSSYFLLAFPLTKWTYSGE